MLLVCFMRLLCTCFVCVRLLSITYAINVDLLWRLLVCVICPQLMLIYLSAVIAKNYEQMEAEKTRLMISTESE